jgi:hypothetical protein
MIGHLGEGDGEAGMLGPGQDADFPDVSDGCRGVLRRTNPGEPDQDEEESAD